MSQPYIGEIRMVGFNFAPNGWAFCNGALMSIAENAVLFDLIGTTYGGDGVQTYALPDLQGRVPVHQGQGAGLPVAIIGQKAGTETVTLASNQIPIHSHAALANDGTTGAASNSPGGNYWNKWSGSGFGDPHTSTMSPAAVSTVGGNQPHENMPPFLAINFVISLFGIFPSQN
jgi:microcystin-dependent protein